ncbi:MAG: hypothetical protein JOZ02_12645 [Acidobacteria bacterium]|nr:hypothetical protein [Acidobacteriota bacterium]
MKIKLLFASLCLCFLTLPAHAQDGATPQFGDYKEPVFKGRAAALKLTTPEARGYRTRLREGARRALNFAGHYKLHTWSCGTGCLQTAFIDVKTGEVFFPAELNGFIVCFYKPGAVESLEEALQFQKGSRLIVMSGYPVSERGKDAPKKGFYYYEWTGRELKLLKFVEKSEGC